MREEHPETARQLKSLANMVEIEEYAALQTQVKSKRNLLNILSLEEVEWHDRRRNMISSSKKEGVARSSFSVGGRSAVSKWNLSKQRTILSVMRPSDQNELSKMITELLYHRLFYYTNVCDVLLHRINLLNQIELPDKFDYEEVRMEEYSAPPRRARLHTAKDDFPNSPQRTSSASPNMGSESLSSLSDSSAGEFELVDDRERQENIAKTSPEDKKTTRASVSK